MASALRRTHGPDALSSYSGKRRAHPGNLKYPRRELWLGFVSAAAVSSSSGQQQHQQQQLPDPAFDRNFASFWMSRIPENSRRNRQRYGEGLRSELLTVKSA